MESETQQLKNKKQLLCIALVIGMQTLFIVFIFAFLKQGYHADELSNFGFANSTESTNLWGGADGLINVGKWTQSDVLWDYVTVDKTQRFDYKSVYGNAVNDLNPPLQLFLLHTVSSLFPGQYSRWFCFIINLFAFVITQLYVYRLTKSITNKHIAGVAAIILFGFGVGAIDICLFLRLYALAVMFAVMFMYYSQVIYRNRKQDKLRISSFVLLGISCFLGCFTLHLFLVFSFGIVLCYSLFYLFSRSFKNFFSYGLTSSAAVGLSFLAFPATINHVFGTKESYCYAQLMYPVKWQIRIYFHLLTQDLFGASVSIWPNPTLPYIGIAAVVIIFFLTPICFVSRKEKWFKALCKVIKDKIKSIWEKRRNFQFTLIVLPAIALFFLLLVANRTSYYGMGLYANRYLFLIYPAVAVFIVGVLSYLFDWFIKSASIRRTLLLSIAILFVGINLSVGFFSTPMPYLHKHFEGKQKLTDLGTDAQCILLLSKNFLINVLPPEIGNTDSFFVSLPSNYTECDYQDGLDTDKPTYLVVDQSFTKMLTPVFDSTKDSSISLEDFSKTYSDDEILSYFYSLDYVKRISYVGCDSIYEREVKIYKIEFESSVSD